MNSQQVAVAHDTSGIVANMLAQEELASTEDAIETRFGKINIRSEQPIIFQKGILGMPERTRFCLTDFPSKKWQQFKLLQSLDDHALSFITLPLALDNPILARPDIEEASRDLGIPLHDLTILLVVSVYREGDHVRLSANARAPLFLNASLRNAEQYVLRNSQYQVRHAISVAK